MKTTHFESFLCLISFVAGFTSATADVITADFNSSDWSTYDTGAAGVKLSTRTDGLGFTVSLPADASGKDFGAGYTSVFSIAGDFTVDMDYSLPAWPLGNGVRVGIAVGPWYGVNRASQPFSVSPISDAYAFCAGGGTFTVETTDTLGTLRMVRAGSKFSGYFLNGSVWTLVGSGTLSKESYRISAGAWSHDRFFGNIPVVAGLANLKYAGAVLIAPVPESSPSMDRALLLLLPFGAQGIRLLGKRKATA